MWLMQEKKKTKSGMDSSQVTGATSSYARKYALNGLFCIDDTKDADTDAYKKQQNQGQKNNNKPNTNKLISEAQRKRLFAIASNNNEVAKKILEKYGYQESTQIKVSDYNKICEEVEKEVQGG